MRSSVFLFWVALIGLCVAPWSLGTGLSHAVGGERTDDASGPATDDPAVGAFPWGATWSRDRDGDGLDDRILELEALGPAAATTPSGTPRFAVHETADGLAYGVFVRYDRAPTRADVAALSAVVDDTVRAYPWAAVVHLPAASLEVLREVLALDGVVGVELERSVVPLMDQAIPALLVNSSFAFGLGARERWKVDGMDVGIAHLDTGIDQGHEAFDPTLFLGGYDATLPTGAIDLEPLPRLVTPYNARDPDDETKATHGTHVASLVHAEDPNGTYRGVAPHASYLDVKVILSTPVGDYGTASTPHGYGSMVLEGLDFVRRYNAGESHLGTPKVPVRVVSMSIGELEPDPDGSSVLSHAVNRMVDEGVTVVAAAGNCGPMGSVECCDNGVLPDDCAGRRGNDTIPAPGAAKRAITVGALDGAGTVGWDDDVAAGFSSRGPNGGEPKPNLVAYGVDIHGAKGHTGSDRQDGHEYHGLSGTSMAAPLVAGLAVLMHQANDTLSPEEVKQILEATARDWGAHGWDPIHGSGVPNAFFAIGVALGILDPDSTEIDATGHDVPDLTEPVPDDTPRPTPTEEPVQNKAPEAAFTYGPRTPQVGGSVVFADRSTDPDGERLVAYNWDFGDGSTAKGDRVVHAYERPGEFRVRLTVTDALGLAGSTNMTVRVLSPHGVDAEESPGIPLVLVAGSMVAAVALLRRRRTPV